ncbi:MAG: response regulator [Chromatiales bacterium]|jgi:RNA polymerase sigma factor (sigma-70 family)
MTPPDKKPLVFVVEDDPAVRGALCALFRSVGLDVAPYSSAEGFLNDLEPDISGCLILDVRLRGMSGLELQQRLAQDTVCLPTIIISGHADVPMAVRAMKAGAAEFFEKPINEQRLLERVQGCLREAVAAHERAKKVASIRERLETLTAREREVFELVVDGKSSSAIAALLRISRKTVDVHRSNIMTKLGVRTVADLVRIALAASPGRR